MKRPGRGFTIVEILVVVAIISLLIGLLLPALAGVRASSRATASMSNLRQWGVGTMMFCNLNKDTLPWEGYKDAVQMPLNFVEKTWWANAVPPFVGQRSYKEISEEATANGQLVPMPPDDNSIFIDPGAQTPPTAPYYGGSGSSAKQFFFCYVPNSQLNNTYLKQSELPNGGGNPNPYARMRLSFIDRSDATVVMLEMRTVVNEVPSTDPFRGAALNRHRADWKRFAARHFKGGHMLFADAHTGFVLNEYATTNRQGSRNPNEPNGDWNKNDLVWDPKGPALDE
jgi:prepilin-type N-terminal cleavage/methylation domain-containing protein